MKGFTLKLQNKCRKIKLVLTDVDGVLTDGGRYFSESGEVTKKFHTRDGMGVNILLRNGIKTVIVTKENSKIVKKWAQDMNISALFSGLIKKESLLSQICKKFKVKKIEVAYIGDDVNDLELMKLIGFSAVPRDGIVEAKKIADYVCKLRGGEGALREVVDLIVYSKFHNKINWY